MLLTVTANAVRLIASSGCALTAIDWLDLRADRLFVGHCRRKSVVYAGTNGRRDIQGGARRGTTAGSRRASF